MKCSISFHMDYSIHLGISSYDQASEYETNVEFYLIAM